MLCNLFVDPVQQKQSILGKYKKHLRSVYRAHRILSKQRRTICDTEDLFINVTVVKPLQQVSKNTDYSTSSDEILKHQIQYSAKKYKEYIEIFKEIDSGSRQLLLLEGNAGTGKTTLAYKVCKEWAEGNLLSQYSHVILVQLKNIKPGMVNKPEDLFSVMGASKEQIYSQMVNELGSHVFFWLEGWDELENSSKQPVFTDLLSGQLLPEATVFVSTRPSATDNLLEFSSNYTHKFKLVGFIDEQIKEYVQHYCVNEPKRFMEQLNTIPCLAQLAEIPLNLAFLLNIFRKNSTNQELPNTFTKIFHNYLLNTLQYHKHRTSRSRQLISKIEDLPPEMQNMFNAVAKYAFQYIFHGKPFTEKEISDVLYNSSDVPWGLVSLE